MSAGATLIEMAAERGGPTPSERAQHGALLHAQPRMLLDEVLTLRVEDIGHLHGGPAQGGVGLCKSRERRIPGDRGTCICSNGFGAACKMPLREVQIHRRVRQIGVAEQELNRPQVRAGFEQMRRIAVAQRVRRHVFVEARIPRGDLDGFPDHLRGDGLVGAPPVSACRGRDRSSAASSASTRAGSSAASR